MFNMNLIHNVLNVVIALTSAATAGLLATGCTVLPTGTLECSQSWIDPTYTTVAVAVLAALKTVMNIFRDGLSGLVKRQPPVEK
jgi:hypothetical protein